MRVLNFLFALLAASLSFNAYAVSCDQPLQLGGDTGWTGWGNGHSNTRAAVEGISSEDIATLELRWAFGFPGVGSVIGNPVVHENTVFIGVDSGDVYAIDADTACVYWSFKAASGVRTAPALALINSRQMLFFGDRAANVYAVDASSGALIWQVEVDNHPAAILTGSPQFVHLQNASAPDRLLVPVSSSEEGIAAVPTYACCTFRGSVVSLDANSGEKLWQSYTIATAPAETETNKFGPSGAAIWSPPTIDLAKNRFYVTTGDAYSAPADSATDAVMAMDLESGVILWHTQGTADDIWTVKCMTPAAPEECGPDQDYGSPAMLVTTNDRSLLIAGQKSGNVRGFNPDTGEELWRTALVENTDEFGGKIVWGGASDGEKVYFGIGTGGIHAIDITEGEIAWSTPLEPTADMARHAGQDGPLTVSEDLVISGGWDGMLRILSAADGRELWNYNTAISFTTINGETAKGGSMGAAGPVIAGRRLLVPSGYVGVKNGMPGNVLLMFAPATR
ncbi:MAG: PQQ-binding-like beta-propeller repeat protein [Pseudomonadota bacterium]